MDGATIFSGLGGTPHSNTVNNNNESTLGGPKSPTIVPSVAKVIPNELSNANLSCEMLSLININGKIIQAQFDSYLNKIDTANRVKDKQIHHLVSKISNLEN